MKLKNVALGKRAVKTVRFRLANAPLPATPVEPVQPLPEDEYTVRVGLRVLTGTEFGEALEKAQAAARERGVKEWLDTHPLCRLYEMAHTLAVACVDDDARDEPFFASADEVMSSPSVCTDNIAFLFEQHKLWQEECSPRTHKLSFEQVIGILVTEAERPESAESPLDGMGPAMQRSFLRTTALLFMSSLTGKSLSGSTDDSSSTSSPSSSEISS